MRITQNLAAPQRAVYALFGAVIIILAFAMTSGWPRWALVATGGASLVEGAVGW